MLRRPEEGPAPSDVQDRLSELLAPYPWDFLLGSVHWLEGEAIDQQPGLWAHATTEDVWQRYFGALVELASSSAVDVLAHPDLAKIFGRRPELDVLTRLHRDVAQEIAKTGVCVEISTAGLRKPVGELYPDARLLERSIAPVMLGSDAHEPRLVGEDFDRAIELARRAGRDTVSIFDGRTRRQEPLG